MAQRAKRHFSVEEYFAIDDAAEQRSEYFDGDIFLMAGGSTRHNAIGANVITELSIALRDRPCQVFTSDQRILISEHRAYSYPDVTVVCGDPQFVPDRDDTITNPLLIVEVLSDSTESFDRGLKFSRYRSILTLEHYLLIQQSRPQIEYYRRTPDGWLLKAFEHLTDSLALPFPGGPINLELAAIYRKIEFEAIDAPIDPEQS